MTTSKKVLSCFVIHSLYVNLANFIAPKKNLNKTRRQGKQNEEKGKRQGPKVTQ
jgi:hypothetical protein